ncbi:restriction endonuclease subunit S [Zobellia nedashkovskayae]|uniref:restriction endonuclease subunit S n=1 Tax=Zobellia nedashkovskayae TaxID=2779510 RepID=UPI00188D7562|nr:restriction endonuclease subunit S [Zobellia nedashkovskayae]
MINLKKSLRLKFLEKNKGDLVSGPFGSNISAKYFVDEGIPVIRGNNLKSKSKYFIDDGFVFITESKAKELIKCKAVKDDIIFTAVGTIGQVGIIPKSTNFEYYIISNKQIRLRVDKDKANPYFIFYQLRSKSLRKYLEGQNRGSSVPLLNLGEIRNVPIKLPNLLTQKKVVAILSAYDDLINNNYQRIKLLEEIAEEIYKEWFVRFRFPEYKNAIFCDDKGSETPPQTIGSLPYGWRKIRFRKFIKLNRGFDLPNEKIIHGKYPVVASTSIKAFHNEYKVKAPCIVTGRSGSLGSVQFVNQNSWPLNTSLYVKDFMGNSVYFVYYFLKLLNLERYNSGAGVPTLNQNHLHGIQLNLPDKSLQQNFDEIIAPIFMEIDLLNKKNKLLQDTRDLILPRLISGKLSVEDLELETLHI